MTDHTMIVEHRHNLYVPTRPVEWQEKNADVFELFFGKASLDGERYRLVCACGEEMVAATLIAEEKVNGAKLRMQVIEPDEYSPDEWRIVRIGLRDAPCEHFFKIGYGELS